MNCETQLLSATWDSVAGAQDYMVEAMGNNGDQYNCSSSNNSCALASLPCGEHLSVWITASNEECSTNRVLGEAAETGKNWELVRRGEINASTKLLP